MLASALFSRSLIISYVSLYTLLAMVLALLGVMHLAGIPLGVTGALALSLVIGMSVDYLIHLAPAAPISQVGFVYVLLAQPDSAQAIAMASGRSQCTFLNVQCEVS